MTFSDYIDKFLAIIGTAIPLVATIGFFFFIWGLAKIIFQAGSEKEVENGKSFMIWGIVCVFVMVSVYGILAFLYSDFGFSNIQFPPHLPQ